MHSPLSYTGAISRLEAVIVMKALLASKWTERGKVTRFRLKIVLLQEMKNLPDLLSVQLNACLRNPTRMICHLQYCSLDLRARHFEVCREQFLCFISFR